MRAVRVGVVTAVVLGALSGCDAASGEGESSIDDLVQATATDVPAGLGEVALAGREADGFTVTAADESVTQGSVRTTRNACAPAGFALSGSVIGKPVTTIVRQAFGEGTVVSVVLAEYAGGQAQSAMEALATAVGECAGGFEATVDGEERSFARVALELAPEGADQAMGLGSVVKRDGVKTPVKAVVFRKGSTVGYLTAVPEGDAPEEFAVPAAVVEAQLAKLS